MKKFSQQLKKQSKTVKLRVAERRELEERIHTYMEYHPLPKTAKAVHERGASEPAIVSEPFSYLHLNFLKIFHYGGVLALLFIVVIPFLAERAVPGDVLYAVKVNVNEEVRSTLARTPYERVVWETERLNRRIAEARLLESEGRLTEEAEAGVASAVKEHSDNAKREIEYLKETDEEEAALASIQLDTALDVQSQSLRGKEELGVSPETASERLAVLIDSTRSEDGEAVALPTYQRLISRVEVETTRAYELLASIDGAATVEEKQDIERRLADIERSLVVVVEDQAKLSEGDDDTENRQALVEVLRRTGKLIVFMTNIDVRESVEVNELVPMVLTDEERVTGVNKLVSETRVRLEKLQTKDADLQGLDVYEKFSDSLETVEDRLESVISALELQDIQSAEENAFAASELIDDAEKFTEPYLRKTMSAEPALDSATTTATTTDNSVEEDRATSTDETVEEGTEEDETGEDENEDVANGATTTEEVAVDDVEDRATSSDSVSQT